MNRFFSRWGSWLLLAFALLYYGQYYRAGLYPAAEGGVESMVALRLLEGERPIIDTFLGYNLLWFYPVVWLFKLFGPSYTVLRLLFLTLCTVTGLMSFWVVRRSSGNAALALLAGFLVLLIPGQMFRNYMAFIVLLNMVAFVAAFLLPARNGTIRLLWMATCGLTLAIAWLIRVDVGFFLSCIWLGLVIAYTIRRGNFTRHAGTVFFGALLALLCFTALHLPFYLDAERRGFAPQFLAQYAQWPAAISFQARHLMETASETLLAKSAPKKRVAATPSPIPISQPSLSAAAPVAKATLASPTPAANENKAASQETLMRRSFLAGSARDQMLALNLYLPILLSVLLFAGALSGWLVALCRGDEELRVQSLLLLTTLGCSLALFPQYFFWRPDMVHLSEFMVPMTVTLLLAGAIVVQRWRYLGKFLRLLFGAFLFLSALTLILYYINACQSQSSGGIATSLNKRFEFHAAHGVNVLLTRHELQDASAIYQVISATSAPGEYLICYPYNPEINFMTDRPSYEYNFYIDNAMTQPEKFYQESIEKFNKYHPVAFVITDWPINNTEESKFTHWASKTYEYIKANYKLAYKDGNVEVFVRPDRAGSIPAGL